MESPEEFTGSNDHSLIMKRKRTKRQRPFSSTSTSSTGDDGVYFSIPSPTTSSGEMSITNTEQDQDMANCLILLARGVFQSHLKEQEQEQEGNNKVAKFSRHAGESGFYVYECKSCNRTFPSFQALGGHRASHKKPKTTLHENRAKAEQGEKTEQGIKFTTKLVSLSLTSSDKPKKMHECSICGSEFSSGQALGGHMRRHRAAPAIATSDDTNAAESDGYGHDDDDKKRNVLPLDLNLPAPLELEDDEINFGFDRSKQCLVFSGLALVDCHY